MSRKNSFSCILNLLLSLGLEGLVLASGPNMGQEPRDRGARLSQGPRNLGNCLGARERERCHLSE